MLYSIIERCQLSLVEPKEYLRYTTRYAVEHREDPTALPLLPDEYAASNPRS